MNVTITKSAKPQNRLTALIAFSLTANTYKYPNKYPNDKSENNSKCGSSPEVSIYTVKKP